MGAGHNSRYCNPCPTPKQSHKHPPPRTPHHTITAAATITVLSLPLYAQAPLTTWEFQHRAPLSTWGAEVATHLPGFVNDSVFLQLGYRSAVERGYGVVFQDDATGAVSYVLPLSPRWVLQSRLLAWYFQDTRSAANTKSMRGRWLLGVEYSPSPAVRVVSRGGWELWRQFARRDEGPTGGITITWLGESHTPIFLQLEGEGTLYRGQRRWYDARATAAWKLPRGDTLFVARYSLVLQDFPEVSAGVEFLRRREQIGEGRLNLQEHLSRTLVGSLFVAVAGSWIDRRRLAAVPDSFPTRRARFNLSPAGSLTYSSQIGLFTAGVELQYAEETNRVATTVQSAAVQQRRQQEELNDYTSLWTRLFAAYQGALSARDSIQARIAVSLLRYDTPSALNMDDRDEQLLSVSMRYQRFWSSRLNSAAELELQRQHTVFLFAPRSAWNQRMYTLVLRWNVGWRSSRLEWQPQWELRATYSVRDYPYATLQQDVSLRQLSYRDSIVIRFAPVWGCSFRFHGRLSSIGLLDWKRFAEVPRSFVREFTGGVLLGHWAPQRQWGIGLRVAGYTVEDMQTSSVQKQQGIGPEAWLQMPTLWGQLQASGWYELRRSGDSQRWYSVPWLTLRFQGW